MTSIDTTDVPDYTSLLRLNGGRYLVLGAGQGIGRQSAHALVANGAQVICVDLDPKRVEAVVAELGPAATAWTGDITKAAVVRSRCPACPQCGQRKFRPAGLGARREQCGQVEDVPRSSTRLMVIPAASALSFRARMRWPTRQSRVL
jgi:short chain dehydrogenase